MTIIKRLLILFASFLFQRLLSEILRAKIYYFRSYRPNVDGKHTNGQKATEIKNRTEQNIIKPTALHCLTNEHFKLVEHKLTELNILNMNSIS